MQYMIVFLNKSVKIARMNESMEFNAFVIDWFCLLLWEILIIIRCMYLLLNIEYMDFTFL
jgi:hypothetical protein